MASTFNPHAAGLDGTNVSSPYAQPSNRPLPFRVRVYNDRLLRSLLGSGKPSSPSGSYGRSVKSNRPSHPPLQHRPEGRLQLGAASKKKRREEQYKLQLAQQQLVQDRLLRDRLLESAAHREREFARFSGEVASGHIFVNELDRTMGIADEAERSKKLKQFQEWNVNVHGAIQRRIDTVLDSMDSKEINERRRGDLDKFLATTNTKAAVFRDIIIESEYDPLEPNRRAIKARVGRLRDPCSRVLDKRVEENSLLLEEGLLDAKTPLLKETLDVELWEERRVKDTPHGFFAKMMGREAVRDKVGGARATSKTYQSTVKMDDYNVDRGRDIVTKEFPKGKKTFQAGDEFAPPSSESKSLIGIG